MPATARKAARKAARIEVYGTVQGVGFRPFVYRLARGLGLDGDVRNAGGHVLIRAAGRPGAISELLTRLVTDAPAQARVGRVAVADLPAGGPLPAGFVVTDSVPVATAGAGVPPDLATCAACLAELFDPADRRWRYPFINCTDCGPRATIIADLPYDRRRTTMDPFRMCPRCAAEYADPADRRFHAEPVACPACGPRLAWHPGGRSGAAAPAALAGWALAAAEDAVRAGGIVAVKGVGGYQLVCDAASQDAIDRLRQLKGRPRKPLAVMVPGLARAASLAEVDEAVAGLLTGPGAPVVLLRRRPGGGALADGVAPGLAEVGLFLPYTPLHHLLLADLARPLVVTSGNRGSQPIIIDDGAALATLGPRCDGVLTHDRRIRARYDDSVARVVAGRPRLVRRARGYAPAPLRLPVAAPEPVLAVGAHLKSTVTVADRDRAVLGPHTGDLADAEVLAAFEQAADRLCRLYGVHPAMVAHDAHPGYASTRYAARWPAARRIAVQHHHAHVAAVAAEHGLAEPFLGVAYDGLGLGDDGTLWGGELLLAGYRGYRRLGRFGRAPLPGGEAAVRRPARMALGYLFGAEDLGGGRLPAELAAGLLERVGRLEVEVVRRMVVRGVNSPQASSAGRLFDAVAALLGLCDTASYEGEAAVALETACAGRRGAAALPWRLVRRGGLWVYDPVPTLRAVLDAADAPAGEVAARFHTTLAEVTLAMLERARRETGVAAVCLGGGVFANRRLATALCRGIARSGQEPYLGEQVPGNDGGISYGQAAVAAARLAAG